MSEPSRDADQPVWPAARPPHLLSDASDAEIPNELRDPYADREAWPSDEREIDPNDIGWGALPLILGGILVMGSLTILFDPPEGDRTGHGVVEMMFLAPGAALIALGLWAYRGRSASFRGNAMGIILRIATWCMLSLLVRWLMK